MAEQALRDYDYDKEASHAFCGDLPSYVGNAERTCQFLSAVVDRVGEGVVFPSHRFRPCPDCSGSRDGHDYCLTYHVQQRLEEGDPTHYFRVFFDPVNPGLFLEVVPGLIVLTLDVLVNGTNAGIDCCLSHDLLG
jgi:hypothetical protein